MSSSSSRSGLRIVIALVAVALLLGALGVVGLMVLRSTSTSTLASTAEPRRGEVSELATPTSPDSESASDEAGDEVSTTSDSTGEADPQGAAAIDAVFDAASDFSATNLGSAEPGAAIGALTEYVGPIPAPTDSIIESIGLEVEREERDGELRIQYRASVTYYTAMSPDEMLSFYRSETVALQLPEREVEADSDDDGAFTDIDFGDFGSHPDPLIWWANLSLRIRATDDGTSVRAYYTVTRTDEAEPTGLLADLESAVPIADGYRVTGASFSALTIDPFTEPIAYSTRLGATASTETIAQSEAAELTRLAESATADGTWTLDEQTADGVWLDRSSGSDIRSYVTVRIADEETVVRYSLS